MKKTGVKKSRETVPLRTLIVRTDDDNSIIIQPRDNAK
jgi:hypothetical protein